MTTNTKKLAGTGGEREMPPTQEQSRAATAKSAHIEVASYAGTGKTATAVLFQALLMQSRAAGGRGVQANQFLALASTNASAEVLRNRLAEGTEVRTFHAFARFVTKAAEGGHKLLTEAGELALLKQAFRRERSALREGGLKAALKADFADDEDFRFLRSFLGLVSASGGKAKKIVQERDSPYEGLAPYLGFIRAVRGRLDREKAKRKVTTFADMIRPAVEAIRAGHELPHRYLIVDEWQDVTPDQAQLVAALGPQMKKVLVLGDPHQTVFGFAGAKFARLSSLLTKVRQLQLTKSQRVTDSTAQLATAIVRQATPDAPQMEGRGVRGHRPRLYSVDHAEDQAGAVVALIQDLLAKGVPAGEIMVLGRTRAHAIEVERALLVAGVPGAAHYRKPADTNSTIVLRVMRRLERMLRQMDDQSAVAFSRHRLGVDLKIMMDEVCPAPQLSAKANAACAAKLKRAMQAKSLGARALLCGDVVIKRLGGKPVIGPDGIEEIRQWEPVARQHTQLKGFRAQVHEIRKRDRVQLSTIHKAKGGEWAHVIVLNVVQGGLPHYYAVTPRQIAQERNLFYVAVTRAKEQVYVFQAPCVHSKTGRLYDQPSQFVSDKMTLQCFKRATI